MFVLSRIIYLGGIISQALHCFIAPFTMFQCLVHKGDMVNSIGTHVNRTLQTILIDLQGRSRWFIKRASLVVCFTKN